MNSLEAKQKLTETMEKFLGLACRRLPDDVYAKLQELRGKEDTPMQKVIYDAYFENLEMADKLKRPCCQDTGLLHYYISAGTNFPYLDIVKDSLRDATHNATYSVPLRQNTVNYFEERNTNDNTGERIPWINWDIVPGADTLEINTYFAGGGCCLPGKAQVFKPSDGYAAIIKYVFDAVADLGINACPPLIVGVGLGHNVENAAMLSKKAYLRPLGTHHAHPKGENLENQLLEGLNKLGIGAQGLRGNSAAMEVHIESSGRHTATIAVGVNVACYAHRRGVIRFNKDMSYEILSYEGETI
ncbi:MAG: L(+)-tartrate dehydratase subunit alpha [Sedimentibacter sp.]|jgi:L(+)-tartrate dehydratase alpha subunit|nr:L(+)-tartrate dehydratase subunit alpha [Sedimentibacter sp.]